MPRPRTPGGLRSPSASSCLVGHHHCCDDDFISMHSFIFKTLSVCNLEYVFCSLLLILQMLLATFCYYHLVKELMFSVALVCLSVLSVC